jgi:hypothetical protein
MSAKSSSASEKPAACIDDSPSPSVGLAAAKLLDVEPEKERWRCIARDWYALSVIRQAGGFGKEGTNLGGASAKVMVKSATTILEDQETKKEEHVAVEVDFAYILNSSCY